MKEIKEMLHTLGAKIGSAVLYTVRIEPRRISWIGNSGQAGIPIKISFIPESTY